MNWNERGRQLITAKTEEKRKLEQKRLLGLEVESNKALELLKTLEVESLLFSIGNDVWGCGKVKTETGSKSNPWVSYDSHTGDVGWNYSPYQETGDNKSEAFYLALKNKGDFGYASIKLEVSWPGYHPGHDSRSGGEQVEIYYKPAEIKITARSIEVVAAFREEGKFALFIAGKRHRELLIPEDRNPQETITDFLALDVIDREKEIPYLPQIKGAVAEVLKQLKKDPDFKKFPKNSIVNISAISEGWIRDLFSQNQ